MSADEDAWWSGLEGAEIDNNLHGVPPYDVDSVARKILAQIDAHPARVLDLGCGRGRLTNSIAKYLPEWTVHGVDTSRPALNRAVIDAEMQHIDNVHYWHNDGRRLPSGLTGSFNAAWSVTMFQHIPDDAKWGYIHQVHDVLVPGGVFVFTLAVGDEPPTFLNHQVADPVGFAQSVVAEGWARYSVQPDVDTGWTWVTAWKAGS